MEKQKIYIQQSVKNSPAVRNFTAHRAGNISASLFKNFPSLMEQLAAQQPLTAGKHLPAEPVLCFSENRGAFIKNCPCSPGAIGCNYYVIDTIQNCHLGCSYCYLQTYANTPVINIYVNTRKLLDELSALHTRLKKPVRIGTGEFSDSLLFDRFTGLTRIILEYLQQLPKFIFEIKTKTAEISHLLKPYRQRTVFSWSINPPQVVNREETGAAPLSHRLDAAETARDHGYRVGFHFDPIIPIANWQEHYSGLINELMKRFHDPEVAWISLGCFRCQPELVHIIRKHYPRSHLYHCELIKTPDGKMRIPRPQREEIYRTLITRLRTHFKETPMYLCMETKPVWERLMRENVLAGYPCF